MAKKKKAGGKRSIDAAVEAKVSEISKQLDERLRLRKKALKKNPNTISLRTQSFKGKFEIAASAAISSVAQAQTSDRSREALAATASVGSTHETAGHLLAIGDSWFNYPVRDVLSYLDRNYAYDIESSAHAGDSLEGMISQMGQLVKFGDCVEKMKRLGAIPKAVLVSGGGNDIAGAEFGMLIDSAILNPTGNWNEQILEGVIDGRIANAYRFLLKAINSLCQDRLGATFPILVHGYDYPVPDGRGFLGGAGFLPGPWLKPGFDEKSFTDLKTTKVMMVKLIDRFNEMVKGLVSETGLGDVHYIDLRGTLSTSPADYEKWWANELHPTGGNPFDVQKNGFSNVADKFAKVLEAL